MENKKDNILDEDFNQGLREGHIVEGKQSREIGTGLAKWSFGAGTILFFIGLVIGNDSPGILLVGLYFTGAAFVVNLLYFIYLILRAITAKEKKNYLIAAGIMLLNLPIAIVYFFIIINTAL